MNRGDELSYMYAAISKHRIMAIEAALQSKFHAAATHIFVMYSMLPNNIIENNGLKSTMPAPPTVKAGQKDDEEYDDKFNLWFKSMLLKIEYEFQAYRNHIYDSAHT